MEATASLAATRFLDWVIMAISPIAFFVGFFTVSRGIRGFRRPDVRIFVPGYDPREHDRWDHSLLERVGVGSCAVLGVVLVLGVAVAAVAIGRTSPPPSAWIVILLMAAICLLLTAPSVFWNTRYRIAGEGIAAIAIAMISLQAATSGGYPLYLGLLILVEALMIWLCIAQHRRKNHPWETIGPRVDSSP